MKIAECKKYKVLPSNGTLVRTECKADNESNSENIHPFMANRVNDTGAFKGYVNGTSGDWWWVEHGDGTMAIYSPDEVFDID